MGMGNPCIPNVPFAATHHLPGTAVTPMACSPALSAGCISRPLMKIPVPPPDASAGSGPPSTRPAGMMPTQGPPINPHAPLIESYQ